jgi:gamma-glutamylcyclotransferase (GGCT)/AIG2-like uncharacterized protein YtfP
LINKLFVYGTLLQGEIRNHLLSDWQLIDAFEAEGILYNTKLGYPAADFSVKKSRIFGELYHYNNDNIKTELQTIDFEEGIEQKLFERIVIEANGSRFFAYSHGSKPELTKNYYSQITSGNWRQYSLISANNICSFAINFEKAQSKRYEQFADNSTGTFVHIKGDKPILVVSSHATAHKREGKLKAQEIYTGSISVILNSITGVHSLYTIYASEFDSNYCKTTELKEYIRELVRTYNIKFVLDIHGTGSYRKFDIYPGIGKTDEFINGNRFLINELEKVLNDNNIKLGGTDVFPAYRQHTVSRFVNTELGIPSIQLEINQKYREPQTDCYLFEKLIKTLVEYVESVYDMI